MRFVSWNIVYRRWLLVVINSILNGKPECMQTFFIKLFYGVRTKLHFQILVVQTVLWILFHFLGPHVFSSVLNFLFAGRMQFLYMYNSVFVNNFWHDQLQFIYYGVLRADLYTNRNKFLSESDEWMWSRFD